MPRTLPRHPDLVRLRREAKTFQRACLAGDAEAATRLAAVFAGAAPRELPLAKAQAAIAREYGLASWPALKAEVERRRAPKPKSAARLDAEALAERWFALAQLNDLRPLDQSMQVGKRRGAAARAVMLIQPDRYAAFVAALLRGLGSPHEPTRYGCAHALDQFGDAGCREPLARLMDDPVPRVRWMAMHALSCHDCGSKPEGMEAHIRARIVEAAQSDPSPAVRRHAAVALALAHETSAAPVLKDMLARETNGKVLRMAAWAYAELTRPPRRAKAAPAGV